jgi:hypothetical protein
MHTQTHAIHVYQYPVEQAALSECTPKHTPHPIHVHQYSPLGCTLDLKPILTHTYNNFTKTAPLASTSPPIMVIDTYRYMQPRPAKSSGANLPPGALKRRRQANMLRTCSQSMQVARPNVCKVSVYCLCFNCFQGFQHFHFYHDVTQMLYIFFAMLLKSRSRAHHLHIYYSYTRSRRTHFFI